MIIIEPSCTVLTPISKDSTDELKRIESAARVCYQSKSKISPDGESAEKLIRNCIKHGHESVLEHSILSVRFICDRGVANELVRHRIASYSQESTRYCNYGRNNKGEGLTFIKPVFFREGSNSYEVWKDSIAHSEESYLKLLDIGALPQEARDVLPLSLKTEIVMTANYREWRNIFKLRCDKSAHPQIRQLMRPLLAYLKFHIPVIFEDIPVCEDGDYFVVSNGDHKYVTNDD